MITTATSPFVVEDSSQQEFDGSSIYCEPTFFEITDKFSVVLRVIDSVSTNEIGRGYVELTATEVDAETGAGSGETDPWFNALQKAVKTKLLTYTGNATVTFTVV